MCACKRVNVPSWPYMSPSDYRKRFQEEGEVAEAITLPGRPSTPGRWGRLLHVFSFAGTAVLPSIPLHTC